MRCTPAIPLLALLMGAGPLPAQTSPAPPPAPIEAADSRKPIPVADDTRVIEEKSLFLDGAMANLNADKVEQFRSGYVTTDTTSSGRSGLASRSGMTENETDAGNGIRLYAFVLQPKEELKLKLKSEDSKLLMRFLAPTSPDAFTKEIRRANLPPAPFRRTQIQIRNSTDTPAKAMLMLTGPVNYPFRIEIQRKKD